jgi:hypothetical protein
MGAKLTGKNLKIDFAKARKIKNIKIKARRRKTSTKKTTAWCSSS